MTGPSKTRPGDQVLPDDGPGLCVQDLIITEMRASKRIGKKRYGQSLHTFNGRRGIQDVREEIRDLYVYITQIDAEAQADRDELVQVVATALAQERIRKDKLPAEDLPATIERFRATARISVDRIMGWVLSHKIDATVPVDLAGVCDLGQDCNELNDAMVMVAGLGWLPACRQHAVAHLNGELGSS